jgi:hypothetical protein
MSTDHQHPLIDFYLGKAGDHKSRTIETIWQLSHFWLEHTHDYIQWLFPIPEPGRFNAFAPRLDDLARNRFRESPELQERQRRSLDVMLDFFGLQRHDLTISAGPELNPKDHIWLKTGGHNHLRITRMIRSLHLCHQPQLAAAFQTAVLTIGKDRGYVSELSRSYWETATL